MSERVILTLEYDMGDAAAWREYAGSITLDAKDWDAILCRQDINPDNLEVVSVRIESKTNLTEANR